MRTFRYFKLLGTVTATLILCSTLTLSAQDKLSVAVEERQQLMRSMGKAFGPIIPVIKGESEDLEAAALAARSLNSAIAKSVKLFLPGTAKSEVHGSRAKPEIWELNAEFHSAAEKLIEVSEVLAIAGDSGDIDAFRAAFEPMAQACGACHLGSSDKGGKFRFPKD